jgi:tetratricopeptide (TPR) repeat protein
MGENGIAEGLFRQAVEIRERTLGHDHLEVAASLSKLGAALTALAKYDEAIECLRRALKICQTAPPTPTTSSTTTTPATAGTGTGVTTSNSNAKTTAQMLCHLACLYFEAGELMASEATFHDALDMYRQVYHDTNNSNNNVVNNHNHNNGSGSSTAGSLSSHNSSNNNNVNVMLQLADTLCNVGSIQNRRKRFHKSVESFSEALDLQMRIIATPETDPRIISTLDNLGYSYSKLKDYASAEKCYRKMFRGQVSAAAAAASSNNNNSGSNGNPKNGSFTTAAFETFRKLLLVLEKLRKYGQAVEETKDAIQLAKSLLPRDHTIIGQLKDILEDLKKQQQQQQQHQPHGR